ncbi:hypothetical protein FRB94_011124 [Tulasnella sp. JGI-2019a]|nr:hypothetical protein FRB93_000462 [Tulasnella sp. JGI-2019a]KAG9009988.1 hypothetical protein FRB94_011124 [Tulasnella sp. JGI-2019a]
MSAPPTTFPVPRILYKALDSHKGTVHVARYSKGAATYVLTGGQDRKIKLWNRETGKEVATYSGHGYEVLCVDVAHDNAKIASCGGDRTAFLFDVTSGETIRRLSGHGGKINVVQFNHDASVLASGSFDSKVHLWDLKARSGQPIQSLEDSRDSIMTLHVGATEIVAGSVDGHIRTYDLRKGKMCSDYIGHAVTSILPTADSQTLLITTLDSIVRLMDRNNGTMLNTFVGHRNNDYRTRACFGHGESTVISGDEDGRIWAWDLLKGTPIGEQPPEKVHQKIVTWVEHHPTEAGEMISASADGTVKIWRTS